jgi:hypothetical protein
MLVRIVRGRDPVLPELLFCPVMLEHLVELLAVGSVSI